jgi:hypothetical protein
MVGSDRVRALVITSEPLVEACVQSSKIKSDRCCFSLPDPGEKTSKGQKQNLSIKERSSTELRFASFLAPLWGVVRAVKGRDERPTGALDSPSDPEKIRVSNFLLDKADDFIDGRLWGFFANRPTF